MTHSQVVAAAEVLLKAVGQERPCRLPGVAVLPVKNACGCLDTGNELGFGLVARVPVAVVRALPVVAVMLGVVAVMLGVLGGFIGGV
jgi:hypothetical protein